MSASLAPKRGLPLRRASFSKQQGGPRLGIGEGALYEAGGPSSAHGGYDGRRHSLYTTASLHPWASAFTMLALGVGIAAFRRSWR